MTFVCPRCQGTFSPAGQQAELVARAETKGMSFIALRCPLCSVTSGHDLQKAPVSTPVPEQPLRCPVSGCAGLVSFVADAKSFWGCGECGAVWYDESKLHSEITAIVDRFTHRRRCYARQGQKWRAAKREPKNYAELVEQEPKDQATSFERG